MEARIAYLVEIGIPEDQIGEKVLSKVSEILGCDTELLAANVAHIEKNYFMKRNTKSFTNYIARVPQAGSGPARTGGLGFRVLSLGFKV